jgi:hypothetical protein
MPYADRKALLNYLEVFILSFTALLSYTPTFASIRQPPYTFPSFHLPVHPFEHYLSDCASIISTPNHVEHTLTSLQKTLVSRHPFRLLTYPVFFTFVPTLSAT